MYSGSKLSTDTCVKEHVYKMQEDQIYYIPFDSEIILLNARTTKRCVRAHSSRLLS